MTEAAHEFFPDGAIFCCRCGARRHAAMTATCIGAPADTLAPEPARRVMAADDFDTIGDRLRELATERQAVMNGSAPAAAAVAVADEDLLLWAGAP